MAAVINPTSFTWVDPPVVKGETGYQIGIRSSTAAGSVAGTYPITASVTNLAATTELLTALGTVLAPGDYAAAIRSVGDGVNATTSAYGPESLFTITPVQLVAPTGFTAG